MEGISFREKFAQSLIILSSCLSNREVHIFYRFRLARLLPDQGSFPHWANSSATQPMSNSSSLSRVGIPVAGSQPAIL